MQKARVDIDKNSTLWYRPHRKTPLEFDSAGESRTVAEMNFFELKILRSVYKIQSSSYSSLFCCMWCCYRAAHIGHRCMSPLQTVL